MALIENRGFLSFLLLWLLSRKPMSGSELAAELGRRRGVRPNPGTLYPALKVLEARGLIHCPPGCCPPDSRRKVYSVTPAGRRDFQHACRGFLCTFGDLLREPPPAPRGSGRRSRRTRR
jgi:DNA-binding PadR family transcriptional regulator